MGNNSNTKLVRGQIRQILKDGLEEPVIKEIFKQFSEELRKEQKERLDAIFSLVKSTLDKIDERQKDIQTLIMSEVFANKPAAPTEDTTMPLMVAPKEQPAETPTAVREADASLQVAE